MVFDNRTHPGHFGHRQQRHNTTTKPTSRHSGPSLGADGGLKQGYQSINGRNSDFKIIAH